MCTNYSEHGITRKGILLRPFSLVFIRCSNKILDAALFQNFSIVHNTYYVYNKDKGEIFMRQEKIKHEHMTISIPQNVKKDLYLYVKSRGISRFITEAVVEKLKGKKLSLEEQYKLAAKDENRNQEFKEWEDTMIGDGLNETNDW